MKSYAGILSRYCEDILAGRIPSGRYTYLAVKRHVSDLEKQKKLGFVYSQKDADLICSFAESLKPADLNGKNLVLLPWQVFVLSMLEGWRHKDDMSRKRFRTGYIEVNRKNGKTTGLLLPLVLFNFLKYQSSESYLISSRDDLAEKTFKEIRMIIEADKSLSELCECRSLAVVYKDNESLAGASRLGFFCDGAKDTDGFRPRFAALDEYHSYATDKLLTSMMYGMRSKRDAQLVMITTADMDVSVPCYEQNVKSRRILNGLQTQEDFFCVMWALDEDDNLRNPDTWVKANPSLGAIIEPSVIESDIQDAELTPARMSELKAKTFGIWGGGTEKAWIPMEVWKKNENTIVDWSDFAGHVCFGGFDLSQVDDITAWTLVFEKDGMYYFKHRFYIPEETAKARYRRENVGFLSWVEQGIVTATPGETVDYGYIIRDILSDAETYRLQSLGYDKWQSRDVIAGIEAERPDILLVEVEQSLKKLSPITKGYEKAIRDGRVVDNSPVMAWMVNNAEIRPDANGNYKPMKPSKASTRRIDGVISSLNAFACITNPEINVPPSDMTLKDVLALL